MDPALKLYLIFAHWFFVETRKFLTVTQFSDYNSHNWIILSFERLTPKHDHLKLNTIKQTIKIFSTKWLKTSFSCFLFFWEVVWSMRMHCCESCACVATADLKALLNANWINKDKTCLLWMEWMHVGALTAFVFALALKGACMQLLDCAAHSKLIKNNELKWNRRSRRRSGKIKYLCIAKRCTSFTSVICSVEVTTT